tara:strand:+ start:195 stop:419 length:225 start_codon:yes stop_codon:yes gene_type:complete
MITIYVKEGTEETPFVTEATTIGELFRDEDFSEDFNVPKGAHPTVGGARSSSATPIVHGSVIGWDNPVADKGNP